MNPRTIRILMGSTLGLMLALLITSRAVLRPAGADRDPLLLPEPFPAPALDLRTPDDSPWSLEDTRGSVVALFFGYTYCPDVCPLTLARLGRYQADRGAGETPLAVVFVSVDPDRDTPERLREFVAGLPGSVAAVTDAEAEVRRQAGDWGVVVMERREAALPEGEYLVDHTARTFILDPGGQVVATLQPMAPVEEVERVLDAVFASLR